MKITKRGTPPEERIWDGLCGNCGTEAEATESELMMVDPNAFDCLGNTTRLVETTRRCPVCGLITLRFKPRLKPTSIDDEITIRSKNGSIPDHGVGDY